MKIIKIIRNVFALIGLAMLMGAFFIYQHSQQFVQKAIKAEGTVIELVESFSNNSSSKNTSRTYAPKIAFTTVSGENITFVTSTSSNPPAFDVNEKVEVLYAADAPKDAKVNAYFDLWTGATVMGLLGAFFFAIGAGMMLVSYFNKNKKNNLISTGDSIEADFQHVELNQNLSVNKAHPYQITAQWLNPKTKEVHIFKSENIWFDPTSHINSKKIKVYIEPNNPKKYYVDISFLPKLAS